MKRRIFPMVCCGLGMLMLILDSRQASQSAQEAIILCIRTVIPSLFPFFLLSACMVGFGSGNVPLTGLLGGYPVGAQALGTSKIDRAEANRMLSWCSQAGPSFIFGIAAAQFPSTGYGWYLWGIQIVSALSVGWAFSGFPREQTEKSHSSVTLSRAMHTALRAMATVCGWVVLFRVILGFLQRWIFFFLPETVTILLSGLLELTNGCLMLQNVENLHVRFLLCLIFLNFGGFCVILQTVSVAGKLDIRYYLAGKVLQTGLAVLFGSVFLGYFIMLIPLALIFGGIHLIKARKNSSNPVPIGV